MRGMNQADITKNLILLGKEGSEKAFAEIYESTRKGVMGFIMSMGLKAVDAEDVMQDTFIKVRTNAASFDGKGSGLAWILQIAKNTSLNFIKKESRSQPFADNETVYDIADERPLIGGEQSFKDMLKPLEEMDKKIVVLHLVNGLKNREIAKILGMPLGTVLWRYNKAIKILKGELEKDEEV